MKNKKILSALFGMLLIASMMVTAIGCGGNNQGNGSEISTEAQNTGVETDSILGEGATVFLFTVVDKDGNEANFEIHTDKEIVGDALLEVGIIAGEESEYGLFVKTVNGITADYNTDGTYWAFYINGEYAVSGVDTTPISEGETYTFKVEK